MKTTKYSVAMSLLLAMFSFVLPTDTEASWASKDRLTITGAVGVGATNRGVTRDIDLDSTGLDLDASWFLLNAGVGIRSSNSTTWIQPSVGFGLYDLANIRLGHDGEGTYMALVINSRLGQILPDNLKNSFWADLGIRLTIENHGRDARNFKQGMGGVSWSWMPWKSK